MSAAALASASTSARSPTNIDAHAALRSNGYAFQVEVNHACAQAGLRFAEVPIVFPDRTRGQSKMSWHIAVEAAWLVLRIRLGITRAPLLQLPATPSLDVFPGRTP